MAIVGAMIVTEDTITKINASIASVKVPPEIGDGYIAHLEFYHQLHCVVSLYLF